MTRLLLRLYPASWRARYGGELIELISETGMSPRIAADIARAGASERIRATRQTLTGGTTMTVQPAWRHPTAWAVAGAVVMLPTLLFVVMSMLTYQLGATGLTAVLAPVNAWLDAERVADLFLVVAPALAALLAGVPLIRLGYHHVDGTGEASLSVRLRVVNVVVLVVALGLGSLLVGHILFESVMLAGA